MYGVEHKVEGPRPRCRPKRTLRDGVEKDCQARKLNKEDPIVTIETTSVVHNQFN